MSASSNVEAKPVVVKVGGGALAGGALEDLTGLLSGGRRVVLVHGGGQQLSRMLDALGLQSRFHEGLRVTDEATLEVAEMVFAGTVNKSLARELNDLGVPAAGISGTDGPTLLVEPVAELGRVGSATGIESGLIEALWRGGFVPVVAPLGLGPEGAYNVNADSAAAALAVGLGAGHLFLLTDVDGLLEGGETVAALTTEECEAYVKCGLAAGGMVPKLRAAAEAACGGVEARIVNGNTKGALVAAIAGEPVGTLITEGVTACKH
ncbi:MAG: acetylglutamate kinase [Actinomycetota bacterium]|nr:acetylglutamate kinase [Actinomycetota bacterium]